MSGRRWNGNAVKYGGRGSSATTTTTSSSSSPSTPASMYDDDERSHTIGQSTSAAYVVCCVPWCCFCCMSDRDKRACRLWCWKLGRSCRKSAPAQDPDASMELAPLMENTQRQQQLHAYEQAKHRSLQRVRQHQSSSGAQTRRTPRLMGRFKMPKLSVPWKKKKESNNSNNNSTRSTAGSSGNGKKKKKGKWSSRLKISKAREKNRSSRDTGDQGARVR